ncbi:hypothetical protein ABH935_003766 [Catenulispora sp. GAS73]
MASRSQVGRHLRHVGRLRASVRDGLAVTGWQASAAGQQAARAGSRWPGGHRLAGICGTSAGCAHRFAMAWRSQVGRHMRLVGRRLVCRRRAAARGGRPVVGGAGSRSAVRLAVSGRRFAAVDWRCGCRLPVRLASSDRQAPVRGQRSMVRFAARLGSRLGSRSAVPNTSSYICAPGASSGSPAVGPPSISRHRRSVSRCSSTASPRRSSCFSRSAAKEIVGSGS